MHTWRRVRRLRHLAALGAAVAVLTAGCGGSASGTKSGPPLTHDRYIAALNAITTGPALDEAQRLFFRLAAGRISEEECRDGARRFADDAKEVVADVAALNPPAEVADLQERFVASASVSTSLIEKLADDVEAGRVECGQPWNRRAYGLPSTADAQEVLTELAQRGYLFVGNTGD